MALSPAKRHGSSPLARGTRSATVFANGKQRFIPAGAGNTPHQIGHRRAHPVHPRWRGEHSLTI